MAPDRSEKDSGDSDEDLTTKANKLLDTETHEKDEKEEEKVEVVKKEEEDKTLYFVHQGGKIG